MSIPIEKTLDGIRQDLFDRIGDVQAEYIQNGWLSRQMNLNKGVLRGVIEIWAWGLFQLYSFLSIVLEQILVKSSDGAWLNLHCDGIEVKRKKATKAFGRVDFLRADNAGNIPIPSGRVIKTLPDGNGQVFRFVTIEDAILSDGQNSVRVSVESEDYGAAANVSAGQITEIVTSIPGVDAVVNPVD